MSNPNRSLLAVFLLLLIVALFAPLTAWAEVPKASDPDGILSWLKLQFVAVSLLVTVVWKYAPIVKDWSNRAIPWITLGGWIVSQLAGVAVVQAAGALSSGTPKRSFAVVLAVGIANSAIAKALWDGWLKPTAGRWLDSKLGRVEQTPTPVPING